MTLAFSGALAAVTAGAVVPEQLLPYVRAVAGSTASCGPDGFARYVLDDSLVLVAYPPYGAEADPTGWDEAVRAAVEAAPAGVRHVTVLGPRRPACAPPGAAMSRDAWWALDLPSAPPYRAVPPKLRSLLRRARREAAATPDAWGPEHAALRDEYLRVRPLEDGTRHIYSRLERYLAEVPDAVLLSARRADGGLEAFAVGDYSALGTAFYMFAFRRNGAVPGCADLLLAALLDEGARRGHAVMNLGLGINPGVAFFKRKWGARVWMPHVETCWDARGVPAARKGLKGLLRALLGGGGEAG